MQSSSPPITSSRLSASSEKRLTMYALAATAAGVGALAATPAEAKIVYTPKKLRFVNHSFSIDLNGDGKSDFAFSFRYATDHYLSIKGVVPGNAAVAGGQQEIRGVARLTASALASGAHIGSAKKFLRQRQVLGAVYYNSDGGQTYFYGKFANVGTRYVGLRFKINGKTHYGWARLSIDIPHGNGNLNYPPITAHLTGYAYETVPNKPIIAGKTKDADAVSAQSDGTLGKLALGRK
jgi:hypothetical protein